MARGKAAQLDDRRRAAGIAVEQGARRILRDIAQASGVGGIEKILADEADRLGNLLDRHRKPGRPAGVFAEVAITADDDRIALRSEEHTSELQSLMRISYAVFCLK